MSREFQLHLLRDKKLAAKTVKQARGGGAVLLFFERVSDRMYERLVPKQPVSWPIPVQHSQARASNSKPRNRSGSAANDAGKILMAISRPRRFSPVKIGLLRGWKGWLLSFSIPPAEN
jgi:hypothetical protein